MKTAAFLIAALTAGCAATPPQHLFGTQGISPDQLAVVVVVSDEVKVVDADGKPVPGAGTSDFYLQPGPHKLRLGIHWCPGGQCTSYGSFAEDPRFACIEAAAATSYRISVNNPGANWVARVTEQKAGGEAKPVDARCR